MLDKTILIQAIRDASGNIAGVARRMGCTRKTIYNWIERDKDVAEELHEVRENLLDECEKTLFDIAKQGNLGAIMFILRTIGKDRGYVERSEVDNRLITKGYEVDVSPDQWPDVIESSSDAQLLPGDTDVTA